MPTQKMTFWWEVHIFWFWFFSIFKGTQQWSQILWYFGQQGPFNTSIYSKFWFLAWFARNKPKMLKVHATLAWNRVNVSTLCAELVSMFPHCALGWCQCFHIVRWVRVNVSTSCAELASMFPHRALSWRQCFRMKMIMIWMIYKETDGYWLLLPYYHQHRNLTSMYH